MSNTLNVEQLNVKFYKNELPERQMPNFERQKNAKFSGNKDDQIMISKKQSNKDFYLT
jgi:hypothetical protein